VHVTKTVDLVTTNSEELSLYFSEFSTICYEFLKFTVLKKKKQNIAQRSLERFGALQCSPWPDLEQGRRAGRNPEGLVTGGGGTGVGEQEEAASYLREASVGAKMAGGSSSGRKRGRRRQFLAAAALR
jgi:hypothetical protein